MTSDKAKEVIKRELESGNYIESGLRVALTIALEALEVKPGSGLTLICDALGWQGGTVH